MNILDIIPKVSAQSDAIAQPTFGTIDGGDNQTTNAQVLLNTDTTEVEVGDQFTMRIELQTGDIEINKYNLIIEFDPNVFTVIDNNANESGTQVLLLDTVFSTTDIATDNVVDTLDGEIVVNAQISAANDLSVNRNVVEITFQAQTIASSVIRVKEGSDGTQLIRSSGQTVSYTTNQRTIDVVTADTETPQEPDPSPDPQPQPPTQPQTPAPEPIEQIPDTSITGSAGGIAGLGIGVALIVVGITLFSRRKKVEDNNKNSIERE